MARRITKAARAARVGKLSDEYEAAIEAARRSEINAPVWKPSVYGEGIAGRISSAEWGKGDDGEYPQIALDTGVVTVLVRPSIVLQREMLNKTVRVGDEVAIAYRGEGKGGRGRPPKLYSLVVISAGEKGEPIIGPAEWAKLEKSRELKRASRRGPRELKRASRRGRKAKGSKRGQRE